jgi:hypothetical protein
MDGSYTSNLILWQKTIYYALIALNITHKNNWNELDDLSTLEHDRVNLEWISYVDIVVWREDVFCALF